MPLRTELEDYVAKTLREMWTDRKGQKVPDTADLSLKNEAVKLDATVLYADLAGSTKMTASNVDWVAAEIYKSYLYCASKIIKANGGIITAYDGDRVMGVFIDGAKNTAAAKAGLQIHWACETLITPKLQGAYGSLANYDLEQRVGIDTSELFVARAGVRGNNDLVWVGNASNRAAKLAALDPRYPTYVTQAVYNMLLDSSKFGSDGRNMWTDLGTKVMGYRIYGSSWTWRI